MRVVLTALFASAMVGAAPAPPPQEKPIQLAQIQTTCFFKGEQVSGMNKICYYDCLGSTAAITISSISLCPLNIKR